MARRRISRAKHAAREGSRRGAHGRAHHVSVGSGAAHEVRSQLQGRENFSFGFDADFQIESYLRRQGQSFVDRFDANSYLYITRAVDYFDLASDFGGNLANAFQGGATRHCVFAFSSDWHYPPEDNRQIVRALIAAGAEASFVEVETEKGHDAFLLEEPVFESALTGFIDSAASARGLALPGAV